MSEIAKLLLFRLIRNFLPLALVCHINSYCTPELKLLLVLLGATGIFFERFFKVFASLSIAVLSAYVLFLGDELRSAYLLFIASTSVLAFCITPAISGWIIFFLFLAPEKILGQFVSCQLEYPKSFISKVRKLSETKTSVRVEGKSPVIQRMLVVSDEVFVSVRGSTKFKLLKIKFEDGGARVSAKVPSEKEWAIGITYSHNKIFAYIYSPESDSSYLDIYRADDLKFVLRVKLSPKVKFVHPIFAFKDKILLFDEFGNVVSVKGNFDVTPPKIDSISVSSRKPFWSIMKSFVHENGKIFIATLNPFFHAIAFDTAKKKMEQLLVFPPVFSMGGAVVVFKGKVYMSDFLKGDTVNLLSGRKIGRIPPFTIALFPDASLNKIWGCSVFGNPPSLFVFDPEKGETFRALDIPCGCRDLKILQNRYILISLKHEIFWFDKMKLFELATAEGQTLSTLQKDIRPDRTLCPEPQCPYQ